MSATVFVLGAGRAGVALARALRASGVAVLGVHGRARVGGGEHTVEGVTVGPLPAAAREASVALVAVRDDQLDDALDELVAAPLAPGAVVLHTSGASDPAAMERVRAAGHAGGTFHPLVSLASAAGASAVLGRAWIGVDGDQEARARARSLAAALGARVLDIPPGTKASYHAAAVMASNFPVVLVALCERFLLESGIAPDAARGAARALLASAALNVQGSDAAAALTGPVARGDAATVARHLEALATSPDVLAAYRALTRLAVGLARECGVDEGALARIVRLVEREC